MHKRILIYPAKELLVRCQEIEDPELAEKIAHDLFESMPSNGVGLAAPQIGYPFRIFVVKQWPNAFINPKLKLFEKYEEDVEGCLSLPGVQVRIKRATKVRVEFQTADLMTILSAKMRGRDARIAQHENDHLNGILINREGAE